MNFQLQGMYHGLGFLLQSSNLQNDHLQFLQNCFPEKKSKKKCKQTAEKLGKIKFLLGLTIDLYCNNIMDLVISPTNTKSPGK